MNLWQKQKKAINSYTISYFKQMKYAAYTAQQLILWAPRIRKKTVWLIFRWTIVLHMKKTSYIILLLDPDEQKKNKYLALINRAGGMYGRIQTDLARLIKMFIRQKQEKIKSFNVTCVY